MAVPPDIGYPTSVSEVDLLACAPVGRDGVGVGDGNAVSMLRSLPGRPDQP
ncbi:hypothetical protein GCM10009738_39600 [Kitasatospora viridis]